jgi:hypothetical protein
MVAILTALSMVVGWNLDEPAGDLLLPRGGRLLLCTDSKSSIERLMVGPYRQKSGLGGGLAVSSHDLPDVRSRSVAAVCFLSLWTGWR